MTTSAKVVLDSVAPNGARLTTFELTYPRFIHAELMTHRVYSRNAASSRAIPTRTKIERIRMDCAVPAEWGKNQKGMQSGGPLEPEIQEHAADRWHMAMLDALHHAEKLDELGLHKQVANRILEPFDHITVVLSGTSFKNLFALRCHPAADPTFQELAGKWRSAFEASVPWKVALGEWHLPYVQADEGDGVRVVTEEDEDAIWRYAEDVAKIICENRDVFTEIARKVSAGRCARVSYMRQGQGDVAENVALHDRLVGSQPIHASPVEHQATPLDFEVGSGGASGCPGCLGPLGEKYYWIRVQGGKQPLCKTCAQGHVTSGNFFGWQQYRKLIAGESGE